MPIRAPTFTSSPAVIGWSRRRFPRMRPAGFARSTRFRSATYLAHVERMLLLARLPAPRAHRGAADVLTLETGLARVSKSSVERRDSKHMFNRVERAQLRQAAPSFDWDRYLKQLGLGQIETLNVTAPRFFEGMSSVLRSASPAALQSYFQWQIVRSVARQLSKTFSARRTIERSAPAQRSACAPTASMKTNNSSSPSARHGAGSIAPSSNA